EAEWSKWAACPCNRDLEDIGLRGAVSLPRHFFFFLFSRNFGTPTSSHHRTLKQKYISNQLASASTCSELSAPPPHSTGMPPSLLLLLQGRHPSVTALR